MTECWKLINKMKTEEKTKIASFFAVENLQNHVVPIQK